MWLFLLWWLVLQQSRPALESEWTSSNGRFLLSVDTKDRPGRYCQVTCSEMVDHERRTVWRHVLSRPQRAYVHDFGHCVVVLAPARHARDPAAVVLLGPDGAPLRRFCLADLFSRPDLQELFRGAVRQRPPWSAGVIGRFVRGKQYLPIAGATTLPAPASGNRQERGHDREYFILRLRTGAETTIDLGTLVGAGPPAAYSTFPADAGEASAPRLQLGQWRDGSQLGFSDGVLQRELSTPPQLAARWSYLPDGRLLGMGEMRHGFAWDQTLWATDLHSGRESVLLSLSGDNATGTGACAQGFKPNPSGDRAWVFLSRGVGMQGGHPVFELAPVVLNLETGEQVDFPRELYAWGWLDDTRVLVTDQTQGEFVRGFRIYDTQTGAQSADIPTLAPIRGGRVCAPDFVVYMAAPSPDRPYNALYFAAQFALRMLTEHRHLGAALLAALPDSSTPVELEGSEADPVRPFADRTASFGSLRLLDLRDPANPVEVTLVDPFPDMTEWVVSPDMRFVAFNQYLPSDRIREARLVLLDTYTGRWKALGPRLTRLKWHPAYDRVVGFVGGDAGPACELDLSEVISELAGD
ncbi:MAG: hypothetical protein AB1716_08810 [Planctomycetota bacterium]